MRVLSGSNRRRLELAVRLAMGGAFVYAGALKVGDPLQFADNVASFQLLPNAIVNPFALALPVFEILTGLLLIAGFLGRPASLGILIISGIFVAAVVSALARGLTIDCGCFGTSEPSRSRMWLDLGRDAVLLIGALMAYWNQSAKNVRRLEDANRS
jgi:uncharacterized membrane protein YphA (DoxX/SURF4 family)